MAGVAGQGRRRGRRLISIALFAALGLVGAFIVSAVAGAREEQPVESGFRALGVGGEPLPVRVEVLNGAGQAGLARTATHALRNGGFDVVFFGNAGRFDHRRSFVIDRTGDERRARAVAAALGIDSMATSIDSTLMLEVTVVLGSDWPPAPPARKDWAERVREVLGRDSSAADTTHP